MKLQKRIDLWDKMLPHFKFQIVKFSDKMYQVIIYVTENESDDTTNGVTRVASAKPPQLESYRVCALGKTPTAAYKLASKDFEFIEDAFEVHNSKTPFDIHDNDASVLDDLSISPATAFIVHKDEYEAVVKHVVSRSEVKWDSYANDILGYHELIKWGHTDDYDGPRSTITALKKELTRLLAQRRKDALEEAVSVGFWDMVSHKRNLTRGLDRSWMEASLYIAFNTTEPQRFSTYRREVEQMYDKTMKSSLPNQSIIKVHEACQGYDLTYSVDGWRYKFITAFNKPHVLTRTVQPKELCVIDFGVRKLDMR